MKLHTRYLILPMFFVNLLFLAPICQASTPPKIMVSIAPIHALVAGLTEGITTPSLLVQGNASPHHYTLRPSEAQQLNQAELIIWIGPDMETFLNKPLSALSPKTTIVQLDKTPKLTLLPLRKSALFEETHSGHGHHHHDHNHANAHGDHVHTGDYDLHIWLDPQNAMAIVNYLEKILIKQDPEHKKQYTENAQKVKTRLLQLNNRLQKTLQPVKNRGFIVFHDAYQYFERRYHLQGKGAISLHPELPLKVERIQAIKTALQDKQIVCVFSEPQFSPKIVDTIIQNTSVKKGVLDPIGRESQAGISGYELLLDNLANSLVTCLNN